MATEKTIKNALAYVAAAATTKNLHFNTRMAIFNLVVFENRGQGYRHYLNEAGLEQVKGAPLLVAHEKMLAAGFTLSKVSYQRAGFLHYVHADDAKRDGYVSNGKAMAKPANWRELEGSARHAHKEL